MKTIKIYKSRKTAILIFLILTAMMFLGNIFSQDWKDPNWLSLISSGLNIVVFYFMFTNTYKNVRIELHKNQVVYRLAGQREDSSIAFSENPNISKDWKGIYFQTEGERSSISLDGISTRNGENIFKSIADFYK
jgi:ABC-type nickel/cobalt efflux system permease component RcnA